MELRGSCGLATLWLYCFVSPVLQQSSHAGGLTAQGTTLNARHCIIICLQTVSGCKKFRKGWRDGSAVKSTVCSSRGPMFDSQHPRDRAQTPLTPFPRKPMPSSGLHSHDIHVTHHTGADKNTHNDTNLSDLLSVGKHLPLLQRFLLQTRSHPVLRLVFPCSGTRGTWCCHTPPLIPL